MSRIGKQPIPIPDKVTAQISGQHITIKGPKGTLERDIPQPIEVKQEGSEILVNPTDGSRVGRQRHGLCRTLVANMVDGVSIGFQKRLQILGVGYRAQAQGKKLTLNVGYSNPVEMKMPDGIDVAVENKNTEVSTETIETKMPFDHLVFNGLLKDNVSESGIVNYKGFQKNASIYFKRR